LSGDGITLPINSNNMGGEGGRNALNNTTLELYNLPESPASQQLLINMYYKNNSLFRRDFLEKYESNVFVL